VISAMSLAMIADVAPASKRFVLGNEQNSIPNSDWSQINNLLFLRCSDVDH